MAQHPKSNNNGAKKLKSEISGLFCLLLGIVCTIIEHVICPERQTCMRSYKLFLNW